jgi:glutathione S-transferase
MDSRQIANHIEKTHPQPPVHLDSPYLTKVEELVISIFAPLRPICYMRVPANLLNEASKPYWLTTRAERVGMPLDEHERQSGGEAAYRGSEPHLKQITSLLQENSDGPYFMGRTVSYADFVWVSALVFFKRVDGALFEQVLKRTGDEAAHVALLDACEPWLKRSGY